MFKKLLIKNKIFILSTVFIFILFLIYNHTLLFNISTGLTDWLDYPLMVYILEQNIKHFSTLDFANFGNISMFYSSPGGMYFTDLLLPQSLIGLLIYPFTKNYILIHNIIFFVMALLNIISLHFFWSKIFKKKIIVFLLSLMFVFSTYTFSMYYHYQMLSYSFFFFSLGLLMTAKSNKHYFYSGIFSGLQFLASAYLGIYSVTTSLIFYFWQLYKERNFKKTVKTELLFLVGFLIIAGYFLFKFVEVKKLHNIQRSAELYVNSSMQVTDIFFNQLPSIWTTKFYYKINVYSQRLGNEIFSIGYIILFVSLFGAYKLNKTKLTKKDQYIKGFLLLLLVWGIVAVLGPRLSINVKYLATPLPYILPLKLTPFFDALGVVSRWFFLLQIVLLYFVGYAFLYFFENYPFKKAIQLIMIILVLYSIEIIPVKHRKIVNTYKNYGYDQIISKCTPSDVVLEYPFSPESPITTTEMNLEYWTKMLLNQMHYDCQLVNGYSGFQPKHISDYFDNFHNAVLREDLPTIKDLLAQKNVKFVKINRNYLLPDSIETLKTIFKRDEFEILENDLNYLIIKTDLANSQKSN